MECCYQLKLLNLILLTSFIGLFLIGKKANSPPSKLLLMIKASQHVITNNGSFSYLLFSVYLVISQVFFLFIFFSFCCSGMNFFIDKK